MRETSPKKLEMSPCPHVLSDAYGRGQWHGIGILATGNPADAPFPLCLAERVGVKVALF
jgi:hypothetical protein